MIDSASSQRLSLARGSQSRLGHKVRRLGHPPRRLRVLQVIGIICYLAFSSANAAEQTAEFEFDVPSQDVGQALETLATQAGVFLLFPYDLVSDIESSTVKGHFTVNDALAVLLTDTELSGSLTEGKVIVVSRRSDDDSIESAASGPAEIPVSAATPRPDVPTRDARTPGTSDQRLNIIEEVIVTGSRIGRTNWKSPSQVTVFESADIESRGVLRIEDLLSTLPQALAARNSSSGIASNTTTVNLRGLGSERTLVLLDGKRLAYGSPTTVATDLNQIPTRLVERVEILTGGATAVYGADAIAGVVNIVSKRRFHGVEVTLQGSAFSADNDNAHLETTLSEFNQPNPGAAMDGGSVDASIIVGRNVFDDKGNVTVFANYSEDEAINWVDRDISACPLGLQSESGRFSCQGSEALPMHTRFTRSDPAGGFDLVVDPESLSLRNFDPSTDAFNFAQGNYLQRPRERLSLGVRAHYEASASLTVFTDISLSSNKTTAQIAPSGLSTGRTASINCDNPLLSPEQQSVFCDASAVFTDAQGIVRAPLLIGRRNLEGGPRRNIVESSSRRFVGGIRGRMEGGLQYEVFGLAAETDYDEVLFNEVLTERATLALDVVTHPSTGQPACRSVVLGSSSACVPWNLFTPNGVTSEAVAFLTAPSERRGRTRLRSVGANLNGTLANYGLDAEWAANVHTVVGVEFREDDLQLIADGGTGITLSRQSVRGGVSVAEVYGEAQAPLHRAKNGEDALTLFTAYRFSKYDTTGPEHTYSLGLTWEPVQSVRLRAQYQRATRSPNPIELFSPQASGRFTLSLGANGAHDPCAGDFDPATSAPEPARTLAECERTGVTATQYGQILDSSTGEFDTLTGGNPNLVPEGSDTVTVGVLWSPRILPSFLLAVDYFSIDVDDFIDTVPPESALISCLNRGDAFSCDLIHRDETGSLWLIDDEAFIRTTTSNTGRLATSGVDVSANYVKRLGQHQTLDVRYLATFLHKYVEESRPGQTPFECAGFYSGACAAPRPDYRHRLSVNWAFNDRVSATAAWRHVSGVEQFAGPSNEIKQNLRQNDVFDLSLAASLGERLNLRIGVNNLFDQDPPLTTIAGFGGDESTGRANTYPQMYDTQGRFIFVSATAAISP